MMKVNAPILAAVVVSQLLLACGVHVNNNVTPQATAAPDPGAPPTAEVAAGQARAGAAAESSDLESRRADGTCRPPEGLSPTDPSLAFPQIIPAEGVETIAAAADVSLGPDGFVLFRFDLELANRTGEERLATVGYLWRERLVGADPPSIEVKFEGADAVDCVASSPSNLQQPYRDRASHVEIAVPGGARVHVRGAYKLEIPRSEKPQTLFGYADHFSNNWKNWDWPYIHAEQYGRIESKMLPYACQIRTVQAARAQVTLAGSTGANWLRAMSHEQNVEKLRQAGTYRWSFSAEDLPVALGLEYLPGLDAAEEIAAFEEIAAARPGDLRARIRLADLHRFAGDTARRVKVLEELLSVWESGAKEQMLTGRNDVRGPVYVALVTSLLALDKRERAAKRAAEGAKAVAGLDGQLEMNRLAAAWLAKAAAGSAGKVR